MKINSNQIIENAKKNLDKLFSNSFLLNKLIDVQFKELVVKQISILNYYEKKDKKNKKSEASLFLKKLNEINNTNFSFVDIEYSKLEDAMDDVNYLKTFINNVYKVDLDLSQQKEQEIIKVDTVNDIKNNTSSGNGVFMGGFNMPMDGMFNQEMFQEQLFRKMAYDKYYSEVMKGEFYEYKTKPLSIIIFKYIIASLILLFVLSIIVKVIFQILIGTIYYNNVNGNPQPMSLFNVFSTLPDVMMVLFMVFIFYRLIKPTKNDNIKYFIQWKSLVLFFSFILISLTINIPEIIKWYSNRDSWENLPSNMGKIQNMHIYLAMSFVYYGEFVLLTILVAIASVFNPKKDSERINKKLESLYNDIKSGQKDVTKSW